MNEANSDTVLCEAVRLQLDLADEGARIASSLLPPQSPDDRLSLLSLLVYKACDHLRLAVAGLQHGYSYSAPVLLRVAVDCVAVLGLVATSDNELSIWVRYTCVNSDDEVEGAQFDEAKRLYTRARRFYNRRVSGDPHTGDVWEMIKTFNYDAHPSVGSLFSRFDMDPTPKWFTRLLLARLGTVSAEPRSESATAEEDELGSAREHFLALSLLAVAHHLYDMVESVFGKLSTQEALKQGNLWHRKVSREFYRVSQQGLVE